MEADAKVAVEQDILDPFDSLLEESSPSQEENQALINKAIGGSSEDKWNLVLRNLRLVRYIVHKYAAIDPSSSNDMMMDGICGLYEAVKRLRACSVPEFSSYAGYYIEKEVKRQLGKRQSAFGSPSAKARHISTSIQSMYTPSADQDITLLVEETLCDRTEDLPYEAFEQKDVEAFAKKVCNEILTTNCIHLSKLERDTLRNLIKHGGRIEDAGVERGVTRQAVSFIMLQIMDRVLKFCHVRYGKELNDVFGTKGRKFHWKLYYGNGTLRDKFKHTVIELCYNYAHMKQEKEDDIGRTSFMGDRSGRYKKRVKNVH